MSVLRWLGSNSEIHKLLLYDQLTVEQIKIIHKYDDFVDAWHFMYIN